MNSTLDQFLGPKMNMIAVCFNTKWRKTEKNRASGNLYGRSIVLKELS